MYNSGGLSYGRVGGRKQELRNTKQIPKNLKRKGEMIMITKEQEIKNTLKAKGQLVKIDEEGLHIYDKKSEKVEILIIILVLMILRFLLKVILVLVWQNQQSKILKLLLMKKMRVVIMEKIVWKV